jgi:hypothetical protein
MQVEKDEGFEMNLKGWKYILTYGSSLDVYAKGNQRVAVERSSNRIVARYFIDKKSNFRLQNQPSMTEAIKS